MKAKRGRHARVAEDEVYALDPVSVPPELTYHYTLFWQLSATCRDTGFSVSRIKPNNMESWCHFHGITLSLWEVNTIEAMDIAYMTIVSSKMKRV